MAYVSIRGVDHYYEWITAESPGTQSSRPPTSHKPVMVFIHGWAGSTRYWHRTARALVDQFDCLLYDLRGFGRSRLPRLQSEEGEALSYELEDYAQELSDLLKTFDLTEKIYLNAHSTGASIATLFLNRYSGQIERAILTCSGIFDYNPLTFKAFHQISGYVVKFRPKWFLQVPLLDRFFMMRFLHQSIPAADCRAFLSDFIDADFEAALGTVYTAVSERAALEMPGEFSRLTVPTLLISGQFDQIIPVKLGAKAAELNPTVEHVIIPKTGHFPMLEDAETYLKVVREFLDR